MWNNSLWEQEYQEKLKQDYLYELFNSDEWIFERPVRKIICKTCGNTFTPKRSDALYCSNACRQKAYRQNVTDKSMGKNEPLISENSNQ